MLSLQKLLQLHCDKLNRPIEIKKSHISDLRADFVIVSIMMGNDYLPKLGNITHEKLWEIYSNMIKNNHENDTLIKGNTFDLRFTMKFLSEVHSSITLSSKKISVGTYDDSRTKSYETIFNSIFGHIRL